MTEKPQKIRTTVTLSNISMKLVNELLGVFGNTPAAVISNIVDHFFYYNKFNDLLNTLRAQKRQLFPPDDKVIEEKIINLFKGANEIPFEEFIDDLELDRQFVVRQFHIWTEKFGLKRIRNFVIKE